MEEIPKDVLSKLEEGTCIAFDLNKVVCLSEDIPKDKNARTELEIDKGEIPQEILVRHIIFDDPQNPLYIEYYADKFFIDNVSKSYKVQVIFVNSKFRELFRFEITLDKDEIKYLRREIGLPT